MISAIRTQKKAKRKQLIYLLLAIAVIIVVAISAVVIVSYTQSDESETEANYGLNITPTYSVVEEKFMGTEPDPKPEGEPRVKPETDDKTKHSKDGGSTPSPKKEEPRVNTENGNTSKPFVQKEKPTSSEKDHEPSRPSVPKERPGPKPEHDRTPKPSPRKQEPIILGDSNKPTHSVNKDKPTVVSEDNKDKPGFKVDDKNGKGPHQQEEPTQPEGPKKTKRSVKKDTPKVDSEGDNAPNTPPQEDKPAVALEDETPKPSVENETPIVLEDSSTPEEIVEGPDPIISFPDSDSESEDVFESTTSIEDEIIGGSDTTPQTNVTEVPPEVEEVGGEREGFVEPEYTVPEQQPRVARKRVAKKPKVVYRRKHKYVMVHDDPDYTPDMSQVLQASKTNLDYDMMEKNKMAYETIYDLSLDKYIFTKTFGNSVKPEDDLSMHPLDLNHPNLRDEKKKLVVKEMGLSNNSYYYEPSSKNRRFTSISYDGNKLIDYTGLNKFVGVMVELIRGLKVISVIGTDEEDKRVGLKFKIDPSKPKEAEIVNNYVHLLTDILKTTFKGNFRVNV